MTSLELLTIPDIADTTKLHKMQKESRERMVKTYNHNVLMQALANFQRKSQGK